ncbi:MAG: DUF4332 domain-containing protein [Acidimicrobiales bacterium]|nr:DUF4332 domain-containing protein [Acidimicrobiales bacterium]
MASIAAIKDIGARAQRRLISADIKTCEVLLSSGATRKGRQLIADTVGVSEKRVLEWVNRADLMRIHGISTQYSDLLEAVGIDSLKKLRRSRSSRLHQEIVSANAARRKPLVGRLPNEKEVGHWVDQAKDIQFIVR